MKTILGRTSQIFWRRRRDTPYAVETEQPVESSVEAVCKEAELTEKPDKQVGTEMVVSCALTADHELRRQLHIAHTSVDTNIAGLWEKLRVALANCDDAQARESLDLLTVWTKVQRLLGEANDTLLGRKSTPLYHVSSWFLHDCFSYLMRQDAEVIHFVTGSRLGNILTMDRMVTFEMSRQTLASAVGNNASTHKALIKIHNFGHSLHAYFHSHPGRGPGATMPSSTDIEYQERQEKGGYPVIGIIFSRDGFFRPFSLHRMFQLHVFGKGVERVNDSVYRLVEID